MPTPPFKVYDSSGKYRASCDEACAAGALCSFYGNGATIRWMHGAVLFTESDAAPASESYDAVTIKVYERLDALARNERASRTGA